MPAREFDRWKDLYAIRPFGESASYIRAAQIVTMLAEINRNREKRPTPFALSDFLLFADRSADAPLEGAALGDKIVSILGALGGG